MERMSDALSNLKIMALEKAASAYESSLRDRDLRVSQRIQNRWYNKLWRNVCQTVDNGKSMAEDSTIYRESAAVLSSTKEYAGKALDCVEKEISYIMPGNSLLRKYQDFEFVGTGGYNKLWSIYRATPKSKCKPVSSHDQDNVNDISFRIKRDSRSNQDSIFIYHKGRGCEAAPNLKSFRNATPVAFSVSPLLHSGIDYLYRKVNATKGDRILLTSGEDDTADAKSVRNGYKVLSKMRHPNVLEVRGAMCESREAIVFITEPISYVLEQMFDPIRNWEPAPGLGMDNPSHGCDGLGSGNGALAEASDEGQIFVSEVGGDPLLAPRRRRGVRGVGCEIFGSDTYPDIELKYGLYQVAKGISFLHKRAKCFHGNLNLSSIAVTPSGQWKLFGFELSEQMSDDPSSLNNSFKFLCPNPNAIPKVISFKSDITQKISTNPSQSSNKDRRINDQPPGPDNDIYSFGLINRSLVSQDTKVNNGRKEEFYAIVNDLCQSEPCLRSGISSYLSNVFFLKDSLMECLIGLEGEAFDARHNKDQLLFLRHTLWSSLPNYPNQTLEYLVLPRVTSLCSHYLACDTDAEVEIRDICFGILAEIFGLLEAAGSTEAHALAVLDLMGQILVGHTKIVTCIPWHIFVPVGTLLIKYRSDMAIRDQILIPFVCLIADKEYDQSSNGGGSTGVNEYLGISHNRTLEFLSQWIPYIPFAPLNNVIIPRLISSLCRSTDIFLTRGSTGPWPTCSSEKIVIQNGHSIVRTLECFKSLVVNDKMDEYLVTRHILPTLVFVPSLMAKVLGVSGDPTGARYMAVAGLKSLHLIKSILDKKFATLSAANFGANYLPALVKAAFEIPYTNGSCTHDKLWEICNIYLEHFLADIRVIFELAAADRIKDWPDRLGTKNGNGADAWMEKLAPLDIDRSTALFGDEFPPPNNFSMSPIPAKICDKVSTYLRYGEGSNVTNKSVVSSVDQIHAREKWDGNEIISAYDVKAKNWDRSSCKNITKGMDEDRFETLYTRQIQIFYDETVRKSA